MTITLKRSIISIGISFVLIILSISQVAQAFSVKIVTEPSNIAEVRVNTAPLPVMAEADGTDLKFAWRLVGVGQLDGAVDGEAVLYVPPEQIETDTTTVIISVKVTDYRGDEVTKSITFKVCKSCDSKLPVPPADCESIIVDGNPLEFSLNTDFEENHWRSWKEVTKAIEHAKENSSKVALVYAIKEHKQDFQRFTVEKGNGLYYARAPKDATVTFGSCWKKVDEIDGFTTTTIQGVTLTVEKIYLYVLVK